MRFIDFPGIVKKAWNQFRPEFPVASITDMSIRVSTNYVYQLILNNGEQVFAKLSYFGKYEFFAEDHTIINVLAGALPAPYQQFLSRSYTLRGNVYVHRYQEGLMDAWVVFYRPVEVAEKLPRRLDPSMIRQLGRELARFHRACASVADQLPPSSKTMTSDMEHLLEILDTPHGQYEHRQRVGEIRQYAKELMTQLSKPEYQQLPKLPVFVDWNIGNFSLTPNGEFFSRWDYDWFRMSTRVMDFYFFSRVVSDIGDKTIFSYVASTLMEERFILFLQAYHEIYPLTRPEIFLIKEAYKFFILNYVIKDGRYFFHEIYATRLQLEAYEVYFPQLNTIFDADKLLRKLNL